MSSVAGLTATPYATAYGASKAAVRQLTQSVAQHCAERRLNIRCNSVHPGDVLTPLWMQHAKESARLSGTSVDAFVAFARASVPLGRLTTPEDVAAAVAFLVSDDARQITGFPLVVDGGFVHCDTYRAN
jgi:3(or 17)beta-hydroxysteroid dehydrogenase